jgi:hypothetical protein
MMNPMSRAQMKSSTPSPPRWYRGRDVPMRLIRRFAREVAERFHPEKIILFGSHAYGTPHEDSDVDILVVMPTRTELAPRSSRRGAKTQRNRSPCRAALLCAFATLRGSFFKLSP